MKLLTGVGHSRNIVPDIAQLSRVQGRAFSQEPQSIIAGRDAEPATAPPRGVCSRAGHPLGSVSAG